MKTLFARIAAKLRYLWGVYVERDPFLCNIKKWFDDKGDSTLRFAYPLNEGSIVFDVGGYLGDFAGAIFEKYACRVFLFEPVPNFYDKCIARFQNQPAITSFKFGLGRQSGFLPMQISADGSSLKRTMDGAEIGVVEIKPVVDVIANLGLRQIDLIKINIEGGEYDLLPALIESGFIEQIKFIQVQFHDFVPGAVEMRQRIREALNKTHREMWNYEFVWESWERRGGE